MFLVSLFYSFFISFLLSFLLSFLPSSIISFFIPFLHFYIPSLVPSCTALIETSCIVGNVGILPVHNIRVLQTHNCHHSYLNQVMLSEKTANFLRKWFYKNPSRRPTELIFRMEH